MKTLLLFLSALLVASPALGGISAKKGGGGPTCSRAYYVDIATGSTDALTVATAQLLANPHVQISEPYDRLGNWRLGTDDFIEFCYGCASAADDCTLVTGAATATFHFAFNASLQYSAAGIELIQFWTEAQEGVTASGAFGATSQASVSANAEWEAFHVSGVATLSPGDCVAPAFTTGVGAGVNATISTWEMEIEQLDCVDRGP